jgi:hydrogenase/urease accessory protein HupE
MPRNCPRRLLVVAASLLGLVLPIRLAGAHDESVSSSEVEVGEREVVWRVDVGVAGLAKVIRLPAPEAELDEADLRAIQGEVGRYLAAGVDVRVNGVRLPAELGPLEPRFEGTAAAGRPLLARVVQTLVFRGLQPIAELRAGVRFFADLTSTHRALVRVKWGDEIRPFVRLGPTEIVLRRGRLAPSVGSQVWEFLRWGTHHIFVGYDHIAFLLALLLAVTRFRELLAIVTSFTVAHSVTLLLSALDVVRVPSRLTEVLIAASIVYVAAENLWRAGEDLRQRWLLTFAFGLVHGLGFASELRARLAEFQGSVLLPVLSFNLGVEVGQVVIVTLVFPFLARLRQGATENARALRRRRLMRMGSVPILLLGLFWMISRLLG